MAAELIEALEQSGVRSVLLKGRSLEDWLYQGTESREYGDVDLLVCVRDAPRAEEVLTDLGFGPERDVSWIEDWPNPAKPWLRGADGAVIDLHVTLAGVGVEPETFWELMQRETVEMEVGGRTVQVLSAPARALHLCLHVIQHEGNRQRALRDLELAVEQADIGTWRAAAELADQVDAVPAFGLGLREVPSGTALVAELSLPAAARARSALEMSRLRLSMRALATAPSWRAKLRMLATKLVPSTQFMRNWSPLARRGKLGMMVAYVWRPFWLAGRAGSAVAGHASGRHGPRRDAKSSR